MVAVVPAARIAWRASSGNLIMSDLLGGNQTTLVSVPALAPSWSPAGDRLVFNRNSALWIATTNGTITSLTTPGVSDATWPEWSADGQWIYFHGSGATGLSAYRVRPDGTGLQDLTPGQAAQWVTPSPDGRSVAYSSSNSVVVQDLTTGALRTLPGTNSAQALRWSPDGNWIAFNRCCGNELMLARPDGSEVKRVPGHGLHPGYSWSPDSRWIIGREVRLTLVDVNAGLMTYLPFNGMDPAWRP